ncbi:MAG: methylmalonyl-CoA carboxyltransferase [Chloroflexi bacterium]|nr:methylmalonyl-CoA carboxyltransferase [Chloroflexota bacterium]
METVSQKLRLVADRKQRFAEGGGVAAIDRQHAVGKLTARERVARLLDPGTFHELDMLLGSADDPLNPRAAGKPGDGVVSGFGQVAGRPVFVWAQDATVLDGTLGVVGAKKITEIIEKATQARVPVIGMIDSAGERPGDFMQYPHFYSLESMCHSQVTASGVIPQVNMVMGACAGALALFASISDFVFMTRNNSYMHLGDSPEGVPGPDLASAWMHARKTGSCDILADNDEDCIDRCRELLSYLPSHNQERPPTVDMGDNPERREEELLAILPPETSKPFDMFRLISLVVDGGRLFEVKHYWAANLIIGFARLGGQTIGIIANNPREKGGCMTLDASDKMARFVRFCDAFGISLVRLADCPAYLPAVDEETRGLIRHGSKTIFANSEATVPDIMVIVRKLFGGGGLAMPGNRLGGDLTLAWPSVERGLMGPEGAVSILYGKELGAIKDENERTILRERRIADIRAKLEALQLEAPQDVIDPRDTRPLLISALRMLAGKKRETPRRKHSNIRL